MSVETPITPKRTAEQTTTAIVLRAPLPLHHRHYHRELLFNSIYTSFFQQMARWSWGTTEDRRTLPVWPLNSPLSICLRSLTRDRLSGSLPDPLTARETSTGASSSRFCTCQLRRWWLWDERWASSCYRGWSWRIASSLCHWYNRDIVRKTHRRDSVDKRDWCSGTKVASESALVSFRDGFDTMRWYQALASAWHPF